MNNFFIGLNIENSLSSNKVGKKNNLSGEKDLSKRTIDENKTRVFKNLLNSVYFSRVCQYKKLY
jgi:hypothetical protein